MFKNTFLLSASLWYLELVVISIHRFPSEKVHFVLHPWLAWLNISIIITFLKVKKNLHRSLTLKSTKKPLYLHIFVKVCPFPYSKGLDQTNVRSKFDPVEQCFFHRKEWIKSGFVCTFGSKLVEYHFEKYAQQICFAVIPALHAALLHSNWQTIFQCCYLPSSHIVLAKPP